MKMPAKTRLTSLESGKGSGNGDTIFAAMTKAEAIGKEGVLKKNERKFKNLPGGK